MSQRLLIIISLLSVAAGAIFTTAAALADTTPPASAPQTAPCPPPHEKEQCIKLDNPLVGTEAQTTNINFIFGNIIKTVLGVMGSLALLMMVYGGFQWLTSAGNAEKVTVGTHTMLWAVIGVILVLSSYIILATFTDYLTGAR